MPFHINFPQAYQPSFTMFTTPSFPRSYQLILHFGYLSGFPNIVLCSEIMGGKKNLQHFLLINKDKKKSVFEGEKCDITGEYSTYLNKRKALVIKFKEENSAYGLENFQFLMLMLTPPGCWFLRLYLWKFFI